MKRIAIVLLRGYKKFISPLLPPNTCCFYPTCSEYTLEAIEKYGFLRGVFLGTKRIVRCHPWQHNHIDPVP